MTTRHYFCKECGELIEGASYDHAPTCSAFPMTPDTEVTPEESAEIREYFRLSREDEYVGEEGYQG